MNQDCNIVKENCKEVFEWINHQTEVGEESITDWLLYKTARQSTTIYYQLFSKIQEARKTGADFEFWILTKNQNVKTRIQAKRLRKGKDHYPSILYSNRNGLQIDKLIKNANSKNARPFYAFYNNEDQKSQCKRDIKGEGVYIACANEINNKIVKKARTIITSKYLISKSIPLSCWFCCPLCNNGSHRNMGTFFKEYYPTDSEISGIVDSIPNYVKRLIEIKKQSNDIIEKENLEIWFNDHEKHFDDIKGLWIVDERE